MLIRPSGYNDGAQEYLEEGKKSGRELSRDELDERVILYGDLDLTRMIYQSIPDNGQDRYLTFTMSFREEEVSPDTLLEVTEEFRQFLMYAYKADEYNFYAEAHIPKIKFIEDKVTGEPIERKPHIHIIIPRKNLLSGNEANPVGIYEYNVKYFEAFQEYINQKYGLSSPREHVRFDPQNAASVLSRYKGDDFYGKNREFKQLLVKHVLEQNVTSRKDFYSVVGTYGETRIRNAGKPNEYIAVKLDGDAKFTNLKETIFQDEFIVHRQLAKPPLDPAIIQQRLTAWPKRAKELKYVFKAGQTFRDHYKAASPDEQILILQQCEQTFYKSHGEPYDLDLHAPEWQGDHQRSPAQAGAGRTQSPADRVQDVSRGVVAIDREAGSPGSPERPVLLPDHAHLRVGQPDQGGDRGLRPAVRTGGRRRERSEREVVPGRSASVPAREDNRADSTSTSSSTSGGSGGGGAPGARAGRSKRRSNRTVIPPYARNPRRVATVSDIEARAQQLFRVLPGDNDPLLVRLKGQPEQQAPPAATDPPADKRRKRPSEKKTNKFNRSIPPYAKNPHRVSTVLDIESRSRRLFEVSAEFEVDRTTVKQIRYKPIVVNRSASTVASYFVRQSEQNQLLPAQRRAVAKVDKQYFEIRRFVSTDARLSRHDKAQLISVLTFERLKARESIKQTISPNWSNSMSSAAIRNLMAEKDDSKAPEYSITGPTPEAQAPIRDRVQRLVRNLTLAVDSDLGEERERELSAKDIYTRRSRISQAVHYLDKATDKTLFVDTGKAIALRKNGITEAGVAVALQLAKDRFGSTLTVNGSAEFKRLCVEAVAKGGMDIHFTDKKMNQALAERRAELALEQEGQNIAAPEVEAEITGPEAATAETADTAEATEPEDPTAIRGELVAHGQAPYQNNPKNKGSYYVALNTERGPRTLWGVELERVMIDGEFKVGQGIKLKDHGPEPVKIPVRGADGEMTTKDGYRRVWSASELAPAPQQKAASSEGTPPAAAAPAPIKLVYKGQPITFELPKREEMAQAEVPEDKSLLVNMHEHRLNKLNGVELELLMSSDIVASDWADYDAALVVATSDTTKEGLDHVLAMMKFDNYRAAFEKSAWEYFESAPLQFQDDAAVGLETAKRLMSAAEAHYGPENTQPETDTVIAPVQLNREEFLESRDGAAAGVATAAPAPLNFVHNGQAATLDLDNVQPQPAVKVQATTPLAAPVAPTPVKFVHNEQPVTLGLRPVATVAATEQSATVFGKKAFFKAIHEADIDKAFEIMDKHKISPDIKTGLIGGDPLVYLAVRGGMLGGRSFDGDKFLNGLIDRGAKTNIKYQDGSLLHVPGLKASTAKILIESGVDINAKRTKDGTVTRDVKGDTPLHTAIRKGKLELANTLVAAGAKTDITNSQGESAISLGFKSLVPATDTVIAPVNARPATDRLRSMQASIDGWLSDGHEAEKMGDTSRLETSSQMVTKYEGRLAVLAYEVGTKAEPVNWSHVGTDSVAAVAEYARGLQFALDNPYAAPDMLSRVLDAAEQFIKSGFGQDHPLDLSRFRETDIEAWIESETSEPSTEDGPQIV